jgi:hypothetical protein
MRTVPARHVAQVVDAEGDVEVPRHSKRLAGIERLQFRERIGVLFDQIGQPEDHRFARCGA